MLRGFNSDITVLGQPYHVQTEDWGYEQRLVVTKVFSGGAVIKSFKTSYSDLLVGGAATEAALQKGMQDQHQRIIQFLLLDGPRPRA